MTIDIQQFPPDIVSTLVALPYRVGLYVSQSDRTGGAHSDSEELKALENIVTFYVEDTLKSEFAQSVMLMTLQDKFKWPTWQNNVDQVPQECQDITGFLQEYLDPRDLSAFKNNLLEIGITVAMAYHETAGVSSMSKIKSFATSLLGKPNKQNDDHTYASISKAEKLAIDKLAELMGVAHKLS